MVIDSYCDTYDYVSIPEELNNEVLKEIDFAMDNNIKPEIEQWLINIVLNNEYYDNNCPPK